MSSLGAYLAPEVALGPNLSLRLPVYAAELGSVSVNQRGTAFHGGLDSFQGGVVLDYRPWENGVFVSGGVLWGGYDFSGQLREIDTGSGPVSGAFGFEVAQSQDVAPVVSVGYRYFSGSAFYAGVELGGKIATHTLHLTGLEALDSVDKRAVEAEQARINADLEEVSVVPFMTVSAGFSF
ncbi:hypothetical protein [Thioclava sp. GXIMD4216]|uniref:hypothetical protein n=1 Tax=Thioclava sp. GXIMD4216 TaxID=3131929 RepID=UPI0030D13C36